MKHGKKATYEQRKLIQRCGLDPHEWLVSKDTPEKMVLVHRYLDAVVRIIPKGELI